MFSLEILYILLTSLVASLLVLPHVYTLVQKIGGLDLPDNHRKVHTSATPRLGGIAILAGLMVSVIIFCPSSPLQFGFLAGAAIIFCLGFLDDLRELSSLQKLAGQLAGTTIGVLLSDNYLTGLGNLLGLGEITFPPAIGIPFTVICIVGVINAVNMIDGLDGLAGGITAIASIAFALIAFFCGNESVFVISIALFAAVLGFLTHNSYPARMFMGDAGSNLLGFTLGMLAVALPDSPGIVSPVAPLIILAIPILDTVYVMASRKFRKKAVMTADRAHLHHRLLDLGLNHRSTVYVIHGCSAFMAAVAVVAFDAADPSLMTFIFVGTILFYSGLFGASRLLSSRPQVTPEGGPEHSLNPATK